MAAVVGPAIGIGEWILGLAAGLFVGHEVTPGKEEREQAIRRLLSPGSTADDTTMMSQAQDGANQESGANEQADAGANTTTCVGDCGGGNDPCAGLRKQLQSHNKKLQDYKNNPYAHDNRGFLGQGRDDLIISARIASLEKQIANFTRQLKECERENVK